MRILSRIGLVIVLPLLMMCALLTPQLAPGSRVDTGVDVAAPATVKDEAAAEIGEQAPIEDRTDVDRPFDLYGNEVSDAVATYRFDATGSLYETHSPQTELPRLGSPRS